MLVQENVFQWLGWSLANLFFCIKEFSEVLQNQNVGLLVPHFYVNDKSKTFDFILPLPDKIKDNFVGFFYEFLIYWYPTCMIQENVIFLKKKYLLVNVCGFEWVNA